MKFQAGSKLRRGLATSAAYLVGILLGASHGPAPGLIGPTATPATAVTREQSIELVTQNCQFFDLALAGEPHNIQVGLIKAGDAIKEISGEGYVDWMPLKQR